MLTPVSKVWKGKAVVVTLPTCRELPLNSFAPDIQRRAEAIRNDETRAEFLSARALLQSCLFAMGGGAEKMQLFSPGNGGKPYLIGGRQQLFANISHTDGLVAVALSSVGEIGVDVEIDRALEDLSAMAQATLTDREYAAVQAAEDPERAFRLLWVRKESLLKAKGLGVFTDLKRWDVLAPSEFSPTMTLIDLRLPTRYLGALTLTKGQSKFITIALSELNDISVVKIK